MTAPSGTCHDPPSTTSKPSSNQKSKSCGRHITVSRSPLLSSLSAVEPHAFSLKNRDWKLTQTVDQLAYFVTSRTFLEQHLEQGGEVFCSKHSLEWFCRIHRARLIEEGQFIPRRGPCGNLLGPLFSESALRILKEDGSATPGQIAVTVSQETS